MHLYNSDTKALKKNEECLLRSEKGEVHIVRILNIRRGPKATLFDFEGSDSMETADGLRGFEVCILRGQLPVLPDGEFYYTDLPGLGVFCGDERIGEVVEVVQYPSADCVRVLTKDGYLEVPMRPEWLLEVDVKGRRVEVADVSELPVEPLRGNDT